MPIAGNHLEQGLDRGSAEDFSIRYFTDYHLFYEANAAEKAERTEQKGDSPFERFAACRSCCHAGNLAQWIQGAQARMRRWANAVSRLAGTGLNRSAESHDHAIHVRRSQSPYANWLEQGILAGQRALFIDRYAHGR